MSAHNKRATCNLYETSVIIFSSSILAVFSFILTLSDATIQRRITQYTFKSTHIKSRILTVSNLYMQTALKGRLNRELI